MTYLKYLRYLIRHKWFVLLECWKLGIFRLGLLHDMSKFRPDEFIPYAAYFYGGSPPTSAFDFAWLVHQKRNKHHWQWWILPSDSGTLQVLDMPDKYRREMLADWIGAGKALGLPDTHAWYIKHRNLMVLSPETRTWIKAHIEGRENAQ